MLQIIPSELAPFVFFGSSCAIVSITFIFIYWHEKQMTAQHKRMLQAQSGVQYFENVDYESFSFQDRRMNTGREPLPF